MHAHMKQHLARERETMSMDPAIKTPPPSEEQQDQVLNGAQQLPPSPREFFEEVMQRPDMRELLARLANMDGEDTR